MHELAIAEAVIEIASAHAAGRPVSAVYVKVGHLRQVVPAALEFSFALASEGTPVEGARLEIEPVPAAGVCRRCGRESELDGFPLACAACGGLDVEVIRGEELLVDSLECDDEMAVTG
jgi:hydrogenase nickel incorporation protein HypA/HybF